MKAIFITTLLLMLGSEAFAGGGVGGMYTDRVTPLMSCTGKDVKMKFRNEYHGFEDYDGNLDYNYDFIMDIWLGDHIYTLIGDGSVFMDYFNSNYNTFENVPSFFKGDLQSSKYGGYVNRALRAQIADEKLSEELSDDNNLLFEVHSHIKLKKGGYVQVNIYDRTTKTNSELFKVEFNKCKLEKF